jgi:hypothetical protein
VVTHGGAERLFSNGDAATRRGDRVRVVGGRWFLGGWLPSDPGGTKGNVSRRGAEAQG